MAADDQTTIRDAEALRLRMLSGETLHHGVAPGQQKASWWLRPSMAPVLARAVYSLRKEPANAG